MIRSQDLLAVVENQKGKIDEQVEQINILEAQTGSKSSSLQQLENICKRLHQQNQQLSTQRDSFRSQIDEIRSQNTILQEQHQHDLQSIQSVLDDSKIRYTRSEQANPPHRKRKEGYSSTVTTRDTRLEREIFDRNTKNLIRRERTCRNLANPKAKF